MAGAGRGSTGLRLVNRVTATRDVTERRRVGATPTHICLIYAPA
jgi:hypothetical protein